MNFNDVYNLRYSYDPKNYLFKVGLKTKKPIILQGKYEANGKILVLPIVGNGTSKMVLGNLECN